MEWKEKIRHWCARCERSRFETKAKLSRLGASHLIEKALSEIEVEELEDALERAISTRFSLYPDEHKTNRERLIRYLQNRGYTLDNILRALSRL